MFGMQQAMLCHTAYVTKNRPTHFQIFGFEAWQGGAQTLLLQAKLLRKPHVTGLEFIGHLGRYTNNSACTGLRDQKLSETI